MKKLFTPEEQLVVDFLRAHTRSTAFEIAEHTSLTHRGVVARVLDSLDEKGVLRHTDDAIERYYLVHTRA
jgi:hypothetical protein